GRGHRSPALRSRRRADPAAAPGTRAPRIQRAGPLVLPLAPLVAARALPRPPLPRLPPRAPPALLGPRRAAVPPAPRPARSVPDAGRSSAEGGGRALSGTRRERPRGREAIGGLARRASGRQNAIQVLIPAPPPTAVTDAPAVGAWPRGADRIK